MSGVAASFAQPCRAMARTAADYAGLAKPRIIELLLVTTVPSMLVAAGGWPGTSLVTATVGGGALVAGSAHATNMVLDRDIDAAMRRTAHRPLPSGRISLAGARVFAGTLLASGLALLLVGAGRVPAALALLAWLHYVVVYTIGLKRRSAQNIVIGGAAGAMPPLIGWAAVTGTVEVPALVLFVIVFLWTPTHFWALAVGTGSDYERAAVPMLPVLRGPAVAARHGRRYAVAVVTTSLVLPATGVGGVPFFVAAGSLGAVFLCRAQAFVANPTPEVGWRLFHTSNLYLALLFGAVAITGVLN